MIPSKEEMNKFYLSNPIEEKIVRKLENNRIEYYYFNDTLKLKSDLNEVINGCLLNGSSTLIHENKTHSLKQFDLFFLPPNSEITIEIQNFDLNNKICIFYSRVENKISAKFEIQEFNFDKFISRGEFGSKSKMATFRNVWTAIRNGYFMSGFTSIPSEVLSQGVITSVNLEVSKEKVEIYPHIHPEYPELYIFCIDDKNYAVTQFLINSEGQSVAKDLTDGEGLFFPGFLGHTNFAKPTNKEIKYCLYLWIIPTYGKAISIDPITLKV